MTRPPLTGEFPDSWLADDETLVKPPAARADETVWLNGDDVLDDEDTDTTLRVAQYASVALGEVVSLPPPPVSPLPVSVPPAISVTIDPPRRRRSPLLRATLVVCAVAIMFEVGWWGGSRFAPPGASAQAAAEWVPTRVLLHKAPRALAPLEAPAPAQSAAPAPKPFAFPMPPPAAMKLPVAQVPTPTATPTATATPTPSAARAPGYVPGDL